MKPLPDTFLCTVQLYSELENIIDFVRNLFLAALLDQSPKISVFFANSLVAPATKGDKSSTHPLISGRRLSLAQIKTQTEARIWTLNQVLQHFPELMFTYALSKLNLICRIIVIPLCFPQIQGHHIHIDLVTSSSNHPYLQAPLATAHLLHYLWALLPPHLLAHLSLKGRLHQLPPTALQLCRDGKCS